MKSKWTDEDRRLRALLRRGDPAGEDARLDPDVVVRMRREMLSVAAEGRGFRAIRGQRLALGVGVVAVLAMLAIRLPRHEPAIPRYGETAARSYDQARVETAAPRRAAAGEVPLAPAPTEQSAPEAAAVSPPASEAATVSRPVLAPPPEPVLARSDTAAGHRPGNAEERGRAMTIRFTTSNGTQIIWTLDPRFEL